MKRIYTLLLAALLLLMPLAASADVIWEPIGDDFYTAHRDDIVYESRQYYANGKDGAAVVVDDPGNKASLYAIKNGTPLHVSYIYEADGRRWGALQFTLNGGKLLSDYGDTFSGWMDMDDMLLIYDSQSFRQEHERELHPYTGSLEKVYAAGEDTLLWTYPLSGEVSTTLFEPNELRIDESYTDADGREWGYVAYHFGMRDVWICMDDPANAALPATNAPTPEFRAAKTNSPIMQALGNEAAVAYEGVNAASEEEAGLGTTFVIALVVAAVAVTAVLIAVLMRRKKS